MGESEKAARYIVQLDEARCNGRWQELPELARKIEKHAPHRTCLALTARAEAQVAVYNDKASTTGQSSPADELSKFIPPLLTAIDQQADYSQDVFQATICLGWLHWVLGEPQLAAARFPKDFSTEFYKLSNLKSDLAGWTKVCLVKGAFLKGFSQEKIHQVPDGVQTYMSILPYISSLESHDFASQQLKDITERLLTRLCQLADQSTPSTPHIDSTQALRVFRIWGKLFEIKPGQVRALVSSTPPATLRSRRRVWKAYYDTLAAILQQNLPYTSPSRATHSADHNEKDDERQAPSMRLQQRAELKRVEILYEAQLLEETRFPKSNQSNDEIEVWTDSVMDNWRILCGPTWHDEDLSEGGKAAVGREVLDILYRAATKTFHSTQILRHLFTVHASLAEFDLAFDAFNSYAEIVSRGKDREEKSGEEELALDDDDTILHTAAEAIRILCRFGSRDEVDKALLLGQTLEGWLRQHGHQTSVESSSYSTDGTLQEALVAPVLPVSMSIAYRAIGLSQAHSARLTFDAAARRKIQAEAVRNFERALDPKLEDPNNPATLYSLALVLAEMRNIPSAIKTLKHALNHAGQQNAQMAAEGLGNSYQAASSGFIRERKLIPLWHLLALLLTARSEFSTAGKACEAAFEQFQDPTILFGHSHHSPLYKSSHLNEMRPIDEKGPAGLVDRMDAFEKEGIIQVKLTQLTLIEETEGATAAVDASDELLALYGRLFNVDKPAKTTPEPQQPAKLPKSSAGTIRGSIFRRPKTGHKAQEPPSTAMTTSPKSNDRPFTAAQSIAPSIQVTDEDGGPSRQKSQRDPTTGTRRSQSTRLKKKSHASLRKPSAEANAASSVLDDEPELPAIDNQSRAISAASKTQPRARQALSNSIAPSLESAEQPLRSIPHNVPPDSMPPPVGHSRQPPRQDARLPAPFPRMDASPLEPLFPDIQERRHKLSLLVSLWLFICGLYTRAEMYEDAKEAINEAASIVLQLEDEVTIESSNSRALSEKGWGGGKCVEELWGDVFAARGDLCKAQDLPHAALDLYEKALSHWQDHPSAIVGLCTILLDIYCQIIPLEPRRQGDALTPSLHSAPSEYPPVQEERSALTYGLNKHDATPSELSRLAARDRAYGLLSSLTKLGTGWDYSDAWFMLARAYEEGGQVEKAKEVLWWCVELEDTKPVRHWHAAVSGALVL